LQDADRRHHPELCDIRIQKGQYAQQENAAHTDLLATKSICQIIIEGSRKKHRKARQDRNACRLQRRTPPLLFQPEVKKRKQHVYSQMKQEIR
jgi:hypothetical protein